MIKAIVFDMGGVYINDVYPLVMGHIADVFHTSISGIEAVNKKRFEQLQRGEITTYQCFSPLQDIFGVSLMDEELNELLSDIYRKVVTINEPVKNLIHFLKGKYKLALLSNTEKDIAAINREKGLFDIFDHVFLSCDLGMRKPEHAFFAHAVKTMQIEQSSILYFDDLIEYVAVADRLGIKAHTYTSYPRLLKFLDAYNLPHP